MKIITEYVTTQGLLLKPLNIIFKFVNNMNRITRETAFLAHALQYGLIIINFLWN